VKESNLIRRGKEEIKLASQKEFYRFYHVLNWLRGVSLEFSSLPNRRGEG
jgi:hypothetical protein